MRSWRAKAEPELISLYSTSHLTVGNPPAWASLAVRAVRGGRGARVGLARLPVQRSGLPDGLRRAEGAFSILHLCVQSLLASDGWIRPV